MVEQISSLQERLAALTEECEKVCEERDAAKAREQQGEVLASPPRAFVRTCDACSLCFGAVSCPWLACLRPYVSLSVSLSLSLCGCLRMGAG